MNLLFSCFINKPRFVHQYTSVNSEKNFISKTAIFFSYSTSVFSCCFLICFGGHDAVPDRILEDWAFDKVPIITGSIH